MAITVQHKRDTASNWTSNNPTLSAGEIGVETDTGKFKFGDGSTAWSSLDYFEPAAPSYSFQGSTSGYSTSGQNPAGPVTVCETIEKFPFSSDANSTDVGNLSVGRYSVTGQSSSENGYTAGGDPNNDTIDKFSFSSDGNASDVGDLTVARSFATSSSMETHGYTAGGSFPAADVIDKFPFSSDSNATDVGNYYSYASSFHQILKR